MSIDPTAAGCELTELVSLSSATSGDMRTPGQTHGPVHRFTKTNTTPTFFYIWSQRMAARRGVCKKGHTAVEHCVYIHDKRQTHRCRGAYRKKGKQFVSHRSALGSVQDVFWRGIQA